MDVYSAQNTQNIYIYMYIYPLVTNIAVENGPYIADLPIKDFHSYVKLPESMVISERF